MRGANLREANLSGADLLYAKLAGAHLSNTNLTDSDLSGADLTRADLGSSNMSRAKLYSAHLAGADLFGANLTNVDLTRADLSEADLRRANLSGASLSEADLLDPANLTGVDFSNADLREAKNLSQAELDKACGTDTKLPAGFTLTPSINGPALFGCPSVRSRLEFHTVSPVKYPNLTNTRFNVELRNTGAFVAKRVIIRSGGLLVNHALSDADERAKMDELISDMQDVPKANRKDEIEPGHSCHNHTSCSRG